jgi:hypothetical protein
VREAVAKGMTVLAKKQKNAASLRKGATIQFFGLT